MSDNWYDTAQICTKGHVINSQSVYRPEYNKKFCDKCGAPTITNCQYCNAMIKGYYHIKTDLSHEAIIRMGWSQNPLPRFCPDCGKPYPWTEAKLKAAQEFSNEQVNLSLEEQEMLKKDIDDIIRDTPHTTVAATRIKRFLAKAPKAVADGLWFIIRDLVSETAKKIIWP